MKSYRLVDGVMTCRELSPEEIAEHNESAWRQFSHSDLTYNTHASFNFHLLPGEVWMHGDMSDEVEVFYAMPASEGETQSHQIGSIYNDGTTYKVVGDVDDDSTDLGYWKLDERSKSRWNDSGLWVELGDHPDLLEAVKILVAWMFIERRDADKEDRSRTMTMLDFVPEQDRPV